MQKVSCKSVLQDGHFRAGLKWSNDGTENYGAEVDASQLSMLQEDMRLKVALLSEADVSLKAEAKKK